jgi:hypothetical protein
VASPEGSLPFEMPASWEAVLQQKEDVPFDSGDPLFPFGHGLWYRSTTDAGPAPPDGPRIGLIHGIMGCTFAIFDIDALPDGRMFVSS